jgi:hypothetical protein
MQNISCLDKFKFLAKIRLLPTGTADRMKMTTRNILFVCKCRISFYEASTTDEAGTLVLATFETAQSHAKRQADLLPFLIAYSQLGVVITCVCNRGEIRRNNNSTFVHEMEKYPFIYNYKPSEPIS